MDILLNNETREDVRNGVNIYTIVPKEHLESIRIHGLQVSHNQMVEKNSQLEEIFEQERERSQNPHGQTVGRTSCIFAFPVHPDNLGPNLPFNSADQIIVSAKIDPDGILVANAECYTEAGLALENWGEDQARGWARAYWESAISLEEYLQDPSTLDAIFPEVLVPHDIPASQISTT